MAYRDIVLADSPRGYWRLGELSGTTAVNAERTASRSGTYVNAPTLGILGALRGDVDPAIGPLNGTSQYVNCTADSGLNLGDVFTLEAWVSRGATGAARMIMSKAGAYEFGLDTDATLMLRQSGGTGIYYATTGALGTGWHHALATKSGAMVHIYVDGTEPAHGAYTATTCADTANPLLIGGDWNVGQFFNGAIDEAAVYPFALSPERVLAHYRAGLAEFDVFGAAGFFAA